MAKSDSEEAITVDKMATVRVHNASLLLRMEYNQPFTCQGLYSSGLPMESEQCKAK